VELRVTVAALEDFYEDNSPNNKAYEKSIAGIDDLLRLNNTDEILDQCQNLFGAMPATTKVVVGDAVKSGTLGERERLVRSEEFATITPAVGAVAGAGAGVGKAALEPGEVLTAAGEGRSVLSMVESSSQRSSLDSLMRSSLVLSTSKPTPQSTAAEVRAKANAAAAADKTSNKLPGWEAGWNAGWKAFATEREGERTAKKMALLTKLVHAQSKLLANPEDGDVQAAVGTYEEQLSELDLGADDNDVSGMMATKGQALMDWGQAQGQAMMGGAQAVVGSVGGAEHDIGEAAAPMVANAQELLPVPAMAMAQQALPMMLMSTGMAGKPMMMVAQQALPMLMVNAQQQGSGIENMLVQDTLSEGLKLLQDLGNAKSVSDATALQSAFDFDPGWREEFEEAVQCGRSDLVAAYTQDARAWFVETNGGAFDDGFDGVDDNSSWYNQVDEVCMCFSRLSLAYVKMLEDVQAVLGVKLKDEIVDVLQMQDEMHMWFSVILDLLFHLRQRSLHAGVIEALLESLLELLLANSSLASREKVLQQCQLFFRMWAKLERDLVRWLWKHCEKFDISRDYIKDQLFIKGAAYCLARNQHHGRDQDSDVQAHVNPLQQPRVATGRVDGDDEGEPMPERMINLQQLFIVFKDIALELIDEMQDLASGDGGDGQDCDGGRSPKFGGMGTQEKREVLCELLACFDTHLEVTKGVEQGAGDALDRDLDAVQERLKEAAERLPGQVVGGILQVVIDQSGSSQTRQMLVTSMRMAQAQLGGPVM
jgi:hypothetical protein